MDKGIGELLKDWMLTGADLQSSSIWLLHAIRTLKPHCKPYYLDFQLQRLIPGHTRDSIPLNALRSEYSAQFQTQLKRSLSFRTLEVLVHIELGHSSVKRRIWVNLSSC